MPTLLEQIRATTPEEQRFLLAELVKDAVAGDDRRPVVVKDREAVTIAYLTPTLGGERVFPEITPEVLATVRERIENPGPCLTVDEFLQRVDQMIAAKTAAASSAKP